MKKARISGWYILGINSFKLKDFIDSIITADPNALNNDVTRGTNLGIQTSILKKKVISNLRISTTTYLDSLGNEIQFTNGVQFFGEKDNSILKISYPNVQSNIYYGNIDTLLNPSKEGGIYFSFNSDQYSERYIDTPIDCDNWYRMFGEEKSGQFKHGIEHWNTGNHDWENVADNIGDTYQGLVLSKDSVRIKYKSSPHLISYIQTRYDQSQREAFSLPIVEIHQTIDSSTIFGGNSADVLRGNVWIPCGKPKHIGNKTNGSERTTKFNFNYGDTYYQRYDCLKTSSYTPEDINQIVEIGSFMLESYINIDGRYDRNRGQINNLNVTPQNFNLINSIYSQEDNFFSYKITNTDTTVDQSKSSEEFFPNLIIWTINKENGSDIDLWTSLSLANSLDLDGSTGEVRKIVRLNNQLLCFQDKSISQILYNERTQITSTQGVPIEIANSGKVDGKNYISNTIGCSNKWSMAVTPAGIYFMDSNNKNIYLFNGQLNNLSLTGGFNTWSKQNIPSSDILWYPDNFGDSTEDGLGNFVTYYDPLNQDVLFINKQTCLAYSEKLGAFTSFYNYENSPYLVSLEDVNLWIKGIITVVPDNPETEEEDESNTIYSTNIWKHQAGDYCKFFGENKPYWMTLISNPEPQTDKIFTNLEFRACVEGDGTYDGNTNKFTPALPFDSLEVWNEYQHGETMLHYNGMPETHFKESTNALKRKFRIWRCDIPRDNVVIPVLPENPTEEEQEAYDAFIAEEAKKGISRFKARPLDRMRNPWLYVKIKKEAPETGDISGVEIHDLVMTYFN